MNSKINTSNINGEYPEPGKDNNTDGFRTNFSEIKNNLDVAQEEISDLLVNSARTDQNSDFHGTTIRDAQLQATTLQVFDNGSQNSDYDIDFLEGHYHKIDVTSDINLTLINWPEDERYAKIVIEITNSSQQNVTINWLTEQSGQIKKNMGYTLELYDSTDGFTANVGGFPDPFTIPHSNNHHIVEFWTVDSGVTVLADYKGQYV